MRQLRLRLRLPPTRNANRRKASSELLQVIAYNAIMYRFRARLTQQELADQCGWQKEYIVRFELGLVNIMLAHLERIADALECTFEDLATERQIDKINKVNRVRYGKRAAQWLA
jgi:transcriptional regulator with XRE-family HTH domain